jgi:hypothetical protein
VSGEWAAIGDELVAVATASARGPGRVDRGEAWHGMAIAGAVMANDTWIFSPRARCRSPCNFLVLLSADPRIRRPVTTVCGPLCHVLELEFRGGVTTALQAEHHDQR